MDAMADARSEAPTYADCRSAAAAVKRAMLGGRALALIRPRGVSGLFRSRLPLAALLYLAGQDGLLLWRSPEAFALLKPPATAVYTAPPGGRRIRALRRLDAWWDVLVFATPPAICLIVAALLIPFFSTLWLAAGIVVAVAAALYVTVLLFAGLVTAVWGASRRVEGRASLPAQLAGEELMNRHWSMVLCHVLDPALVSQVVSDAHSRARDLDQQPTGPVAEGGPDLLMCPERGFTTSDAMSAAAAMPTAMQLPGFEPLIVIGDRTKLRRPDRDALASPRGITFIVTMFTATLAVEGVIIVFEERSACSTQCSGALTSYPEAMYWLLSNFFWLGDPAGLAAAATTTRIMGLMAPLMGVTLVSCIAAAVVRYVRARARAVPAAYDAMESAFDGGRPDLEPKPTVGIVTVLAAEFDAVWSLLEQPREWRVERDRFPYVVGTFPSALKDRHHEVVLTKAPRAGNETAATVCTNLIASFPTLNCLILVGIAAGVPNLRQPEKHVRLGDVVAATWGIIDYDHVDQRLEGSELRGGFPQPSPWLTAAAGHLEAKELAGLRPWERWLDIAERPELARYERPAASNDVLMCEDGTGRPAEHPDVALSHHRPDVPKLHYGRIGSANRSLRDGRVRDVVAAKYDLRAFEMEASGVGTSGFLNGLEWFIVRGVSDYGDSATPQTWRAYAAYAAAAYTRALLAECAPLAPRGGHTRGGPVETKHAPSPG